MLSYVQQFSYALFVYVVLYIIHVIDLSKHQVTDYPGISRLIELGNTHRYVGFILKIYVDGICGRGYPNFMLPDR